MKQSSVWPFEAEKTECDKRPKGHPFGGLLTMHGRVGETLVYVDTDKINVSEN